MAKRFQFRLETLLRVRDIREREAKRKVGAKLAEIASVDQLNRQTAEEIAALYEKLRQLQRREVLAPNELARERAWIGHLHRTVIERQALRDKLVKELQVLQQELREARREKRIIEKLRERRWQDFVKDRQRREQAESDELARQLLAFHAVGGSAKDDR